MLLPSAAHWLLHRSGPWLLRWLEQNLEKVLPQPPKLSEVSVEREGRTAEHLGGVFHQDVPPLQQAFLSPRVPQGDLPLAIFLMEGECPVMGISGAALSPCTVLTSGYHWPGCGVHRACFDL